MQKRYHWLYVAYTFLDTVAGKDLFSILVSSDWIALQPVHAQPVHTLLGVTRSLI